MSSAPRVLFVTYGGGHAGMVLPVMHELEALLPGVDCRLMALTTGHLKAKAARPAARLAARHADRQRRHPTIV